MVVKRLTLTPRQRRIDKLFNDVDFKFTKMASAIRRLVQNVPKKRLFEKKNFAQIKRTNKINVTLSRKFHLQCALNGKRPRNEGGKGGGGVTAKVIVTLQNSKEGPVPCKTLIDLIVVFLPSYRL